MQTAIDALREQLERADSEKDDLRNQRDRAQQAENQFRSELQSERDFTRRLTERIAELEAQLAQQSAPHAAESPDVDAISADLEHEGLPPSAWLEEAWGAGGSNDHSSTADPAHQVERLWQRIEEVEHRLEEARVVAEPESRSEPEAGTASAMSSEDADTDTQSERPRRWWRRVLRRRHN